MIQKIDGSCYIDLMHSGIKNLERYRSKLNDLNVFPVPDGDTGTNMVMTLRSGYEAIKNQSASVSDISGRFSSAAVFGARGNSGVIVSQFFKGLSEGLKGLDYASPDDFANALQNGCKFAYASVAQPVEGTMLTVIKDASAAVMKELPLQSINSVIDIFLLEARVSLARTPDLLPILKKASVVDSGGSGIVCFFEGVKKHLNGEEIENAEEAVSTGEYVDLSMFNKDTDFKYGYCCESLLQLKMDVCDFDHKTFKATLMELGESVVSSLEGDKVKLHVHVKQLSPLMEYCQRYGEFLTIKIENMSVQNLQKESEEKEKEIKKFLYDEDREPSETAVIAVASNQYMQECFFNMGADVVILSEIAPSSQDFMDAFEIASSKNIIVFPNSANSILSAMQAGSLYKKSKVTVLNSRSIAECYAILSILDFEGTVDEAITLANDTLSSIYQFSIYQAVRDVKYGDRSIDKNDFFALSNSKILDVEDTLEAITLHTIDGILKKQDYEVITLFYGKSVSDEYIESLVEKLNEMGHDAEFATVSTFETLYDITVTFE